MNRDPLRASSEDARFIIRLFVLSGEAEPVVAGAGANGHLFDVRVLLGGHNLGPVLHLIAIPGGDPNAAFVIVRRHPGSSDELTRRGDSQSAMWVTIEEFNIFLLGEDACFGHPVVFIHRKPASGGRFWRSRRYAHRAMVGPVERG